MPISPKLEKKLSEWTAAGALDVGSAQRVRDYENARVEPRFRWPIIIALAFGALLMGAGILLFIAAHWDDLSPSSRFALVLVMTAGFHVAGAFAAEKFEKLAIALHAIGTVTLGAGIFLAGQIFNLEEHWPGGVMLWALGAWIAWFIRRDWTQALLAAILTPWWLAGEWMVATQRHHGNSAEQILAAGIALLSLAYISLRKTGERDLAGRAISAVGCVAFLPAAVTLILESPFRWWWSNPLPSNLRLMGWTGALLLPALLALPFRRAKAWMNAVAAPWVFLGSYLAGFIAIEKNAVLPIWAVSTAALMMAWGIAEERRELRILAQFAFGFAAVDAMVWANDSKSFFAFLVCLAGCVAWCWYGTRYGQKAMINGGIAMFGVTVMFFYFSSIMDKMDRSLSLIGLGLLFLLGGWFLEKTRRRLVAMAKGAGA
ncbi:MAG TPA: DUF2157 domain-containing protein [Terriglobales bacterium]|nr:DUF2157 domain-containing protein [Terriglobales bacterium]